MGGEYVRRNLHVLNISLGFLIFRTPSYEQACVCRQARGGVWGVLTCLFVGYLVSLAYPLVSLWFPSETVLGTEMFLVRPAAHFRGCLHAC